MSGLIILLFFVVPSVISKQWNSIEELEKYPYLRNDRFHQQPRMYESAPSPWIDGPNFKRYQFNIGHQSWLAAREHCLTQNADLASIEDHNEINWILNHYQPHYKHLRERQIQVGLLIDGYDSTREWKWVNGNPLNRTLLSWINGEPYDHADGRERCALLSVNSRSLDDIDCDLPASEHRLFRFVCERTNDVHLKHEKATNPLMKKLEELLSFFGINPNQTNTGIEPTPIESSGEDYLDKVSTDKVKASEKTTQAQAPSTDSILSTTIESILPTSFAPKEIELETRVSGTEISIDKPQLEERKSDDIQSKIVLEKVETQKTENLSIKTPESLNLTEDELEEKQKTKILSNILPIQILNDNSNASTTKFSEGRQFFNGSNEENTFEQPKNTFALIEFSEKVGTSKDNLVPLELTSTSQQNLHAESPFPENDTANRTAEITDIRKTSSENSTVEPFEKDTKITSAQRILNYGGLPPEKTSTETLSDTTKFSAEDKLSKLRMKPIFIKLSKNLPLTPDELQIKEDPSKIDIDNGFEKEKFPTHEPISKPDPLQNLAENIENMAKTVPLADPKELESKMEHLERIVSAVQKMIEPLEARQNGSNIQSKVQNSTLQPEELVASAMLSALMHGIGLVESQQDIDQKDTPRQNPEITYDHPLSPFRRDFPRRPVLYADEKSLTKQKLHGVKTHSSAASHDGVFNNTSEATGHFLDDKQNDNNVEENMDENHKEIVAKEIMIQSIEQDFEDSSNETTPILEKILPFTHQPFECDNSETEEETNSEDKKAEKIEKFLVSLRKFLERASTKDLKQLIDDSKSEKKPIIQKLDEAVNLVMQRELKKMDESDKLNPIGVDANKVKKQMADIRTEVAGHRNSIDQNIVGDSKNSEEISNDKLKTNINASNVDENLNGRKNLTDDGYEYNLFIDLANYTTNSPENEPILTKIAENTTILTEESSTTVSPTPEIYSPISTLFGERTTITTQKVEPETTETSQIENGIGSPLENSTQNVEKNTLAERKIIETTSEIPENFPSTEPRTSSTTNTLPETIETKFLTSEPLLNHSELGKEPLLIENSHIETILTNITEIENATISTTNGTDLMKIQFRIEELPMNISSEKTTTENELLFESKLRPERTDEMRKLEAEEELENIRKNQTIHREYTSNDIGRITPRQLEELRNEEKRVQERNKLEAEKIAKVYKEFNSRTNLDELVNNVKESEKKLSQTSTSSKLPENKSLIVQMTKVFEEIGKNFRKLLDASLT